MSQEPNDLKLGIPASKTITNFFNHLKIVDLCGADHTFESAETLLFLNEAEAERFKKEPLCTKHLQTKKTQNDQNC